ncbi:MAG: bifunctional ornithine acetyltransferase/N-acetylglutamate synthase [Rickettsiales bacterium]|nr:bifunctional ornithine acetyltransferase/N-acetylglutamate synthase [Rickettsiales bacterium]RPG13490.1 MAG: bifunctional glutamate N-acetyltransferase/amino-acid acetyltransferase ArgJ [Pelagibacteraceae bacterium TMED195]|tara:strand:+ start:5865 stop:7091 length:1227 start_codon:yes stop_codon:yes gene_type:complete
MIIKTSPLAPNKLKKLYEIDGVSVSSVSCGIKKNFRDDLVLIKFDLPSQIYGVFTNSKTPGAPIIWNKSIIKNGKVSALIINSGNANVFNGKKGEEALKKIITALSLKLSINQKEIYMASTGVIGEPLDYKKIIRKIPLLIKNLNNNPQSWLKAANAIRTTDTFPKLYSEKIKYNEKEKIYINGIAKGSGMIAPNMATMLSFVISNITLKKSEIKKEFNNIVEKTFNSITVDSDTSTSDMVLLVLVKNKKSLPPSKKKEFFNKLESLMANLSHLIVKDGEGASKFIKISIDGAQNYKDAKKLGMSIANSPLFKTAMAGSDSNWGRIIMALGKTGVTLENSKISIKFGKLFILKSGQNLLSKNIKRINNYLKRKEIEISVTVGKGNGCWSVWTCDLTKSYISINTDYRS